MENKIQHPIPFGSIIGIGNKNRFEIIGIDLERCVYKVIGEEFELLFENVEAIYEVKLSEVKKESVRELLDEKEDGVKSGDMTKHIMAGGQVINYEKDKVNILPEKDYWLSVKNDRLIQLSVAISSQLANKENLNADYINEYNGLIDNLKDNV